MLGICRPAMEDSEGGRHPRRPVASAVKVGRGTSATLRQGMKMPVYADQVPVVAICSGKGGVGKTTAAVNIALALNAQNVRVGLVDADLYGPDAAHMLGLRRKVDTPHITLFAAKGEARSRLETAERHGVQIASAALLVGEGQGLGVQAPIAQLLVHRLIADVNWDNIECLVVDLPPGIADIQQFVFTLGPRKVIALLVVTPQVVAHRDAARLLHQLRWGRVGILGGIENMASQICPSCGEITPLFPPAPPEEAIWARIPKLASVPFSSRAAADADGGAPVMITRAVPEQVAAYEAVARKVMAALVGEEQGDSAGW